jgi:hypothetical protein
VDKNGDDDQHDGSDDDDDDDGDETPEMEAAMAIQGWLEAQMVNKIFKLEAKILCEELRVETTWPVPYKGDEEQHDEEEYYEQQEAYYEETDDEVAEAWEQEADGRGKGARKRSRSEFEEGDDEPQEYSEDEYSEDESEYEQDDEDDDEDDYEEEKEEEEDLEEEQAMPPSPPTKRVKFAHPCVVPSCDKGYVNKASLQRHVFKDHDRVSDPVAQRACRLLWGETFKGGRLPEVNRRYGEYPKDA